MSQEEIKNAEFLTGATNADKIQKTLSYLVFFSLFIDIQQPVKKGWVL
jgi:hypothetical protein